MITGSRGLYRWIVWESQFLCDLVSAVPNIVRGKHVVITSFDSGRFLPSKEMIDKGWSVKLGLAYSPRIQHRVDLPFHPFDEWYVFPTLTRIGYPEVFVNYSGFRLRYGETAIERQAMLERFWRQLEVLQPESYLAEGDFLIFVTRNGGLYEDVLLWDFPRPEQTRSSGDSD